MQGEIEKNIGKLRNLEKLKFPFWVEGTFGDNILWSGGGGRRARWGWGSVGRKGNGTVLDGQGREGSAGCRRARWQLLG